MSKQWRSRTEYKNKKGKIIKMQNISSIFNDQDYYVLYDPEGSYIEACLNFNTLMQKIV